jgi:hypothetical protein
MEWLKNPGILEINTWVWLREPTEKYGRSISLENIPAEELDGEIRDFDAVWLMGVWERSPRAGRSLFNIPSSWKNSAGH